MSDTTSEPRYSKDAANRILFLIDNLRPGGAQKAVLALCRALRDREIGVAVWRLGGTSEFEEKFQALGVPVLGGSDSVFKLLREPFSLFRHLRRNKVLLVQTFLFYSDIAGRVIGRLARLFGGARKTPVVVSSVRATNIRNRWWQFALQRATASLADAFTAVSQRTLDFAVEREGVVAERSEVIPNGIDLASWDALPDSQTARAALGLPQNGVVIGAAGRLHAQKGNEFLLAAAKTVLVERSDAFFVIAGYGPLRRRLEAQARSLGIDSQVRFLGFQSDMRTVLAALDIFVLPSLWEGMSNAVLEAMAASKPVVATAVDGNVEQVVDGETGLLVPPADAEALATALLTLLRDSEKAREMGRAGRRRAEREFPLERMIDAHLRLYERLLKDKAGIAPHGWR